MIKEVQDLMTQAEAAGTTLTELCRRSGVARSTPQRWMEKDTTAGPTLNTMQKLRDALAAVVAERKQKMAAAGL